MLMFANNNKCLSLSRPLLILKYSWQPNHLARARLPSLFISLLPLLSHPIFAPFVSMHLFLLQSSNKRQSTLSSISIQSCIPLSSSLLSPFPPRRRDDLTHSLHPLHPNLHTERQCEKRNTAKKKPAKTHFSPNKLLGSKRRVNLI